VEDVIQLSAREGYLVKLLDNEEYALASAPGRLVGVTRLTAARRGSRFEREFGSLSNSDPTNNPPTPHPRNRLAERAPERAIRY
jgi:hypothetical protein